MVDIAQAAQNAFAMDKTNHCPHLARLGICLEPEMCFLLHDVASIESTATPQMSTAAKEFNPFAQNSGTSSSTFKEFVPGQKEEVQTAQSGIIDMLGRIGMEVQVDPELGTVFVQQFENCTCCHGMINNCRGDFCENIGMCFCVSDTFHKNQ